MKSYKRIWLLRDHWEGEPCQVWCDHPAPGIGQEEEDADGPYIHVNEILKLIKVERDGLRLACHNCCCISLGDGILDEFEELIKEGV